MYRAVLTPTEKNHTVELPKEFFGKEVVISVSEVVPPEDLPNNLKNKSFWEDIEFNPNFPSIGEIRKTAWPKK